MRRAFLAFIILCAGFLGILLMQSALPSTAAPLAQEATPIPNLSISDEYCSSCHGQPGQTFPLEDGTLLDLYVDPLEHENSIHGSQGYACVQCHADVGEYPHPPFSATDRRDVTLQLNVVCQRCHATQYELAMDSVHATALEEGNRAAAVCSDCHTAHAVQDWVDEDTGETLPEARAIIPQTCAQCHNDIYQTYLTSVHGSALAEGNPDVPTCIDCHGVHNIEDPTTSAFRLSSPQMCAECHTDPDVMGKYGISTDVLNTYVADFHGTTVTIFQHQNPEAETNKPVCFDCHGVHDIKRADDPEKGLQVKENLLITCQKCHPDAADNFPTSWLSHYIPSPENYPLVYYVDLFYKIFIPTVIGGMGLLVVMDFSRAMINRSRRRKTAPAEGEQAADAPDEEMISGEDETTLPPAEAAPETSQAGEVTTTIEEPPATDSQAVPPDSAEPEPDDGPPGEEGAEADSSQESRDEDQPGEEVRNG
jgi:hypothetical protein